MSESFRKQLLAYLDKDRKKAESIGYRLGRSVDKKVGERVFNESLKQCKTSLRKSFGDSKWRGFSAEEREILESDCTVGATRFLIKSLEDGIRR